MPTKSVWVSGREAAEIMSKNNGREIKPDYVRLRSNQGKIRSRPIDGRTKEYYRHDVENYIVRAKKTTQPATTS